MHSETKIRLAVIGNPDSPHVKKRVERFKSQQNFDVQLFNSAPPEAEKPKSKLEEILSLLPKFGTLFWLFRRYKPLKEYKPDLIFIMYADPYTLFISSFFPIPVAVSAWGGDILREQGALGTKMMRMMSRRGLKKADAIFAVSEHLKRSILEFMGRTTIPEPVVLHYGIDLETYRYEPLKRHENESLERPENEPSERQENEPSEKQESESPKKQESESSKRQENDSPKRLENEPSKRPDLGAENGRVITFLSPRWALPIYNIKAAVKGFIHLCRLEKPVFLLYRNCDLNDSDESIEYAGEIKQELDKAGCSDKTSELGLLNEAERLAIYERSDVVVSLSRSDGTPVSVLEAMAMGKIVVCHNIPSLKALIDHGVNGFLVDGNDEKEVAELFCKIVDEFESISETVGVRAREYVEMHANLDREVGIYVNLFRKLTAGVM